MKRFDSEVALRRRIEKKEWEEFMENNIENHDIYYINRSGKKEIAICETKTW